MSHDKWTMKAACHGEIYKDIKQNKLNNFCVMSNI